MNRYTQGMPKQTLPRQAAGVRTEGVLRFYIYLLNTHYSYAALMGAWFKLICPPAAIIYKSIGAAAWSRMQETSNIMREVLGCR